MQWDAQRWQNVAMKSFLVESDGGKDWTQSFSKVIDAQWAFWLHSFCGDFEGINVFYNKT